MKKFLKNKHLFIWVMLPVFMIGGFLSSSYSVKAEESATSTTSTPSTSSTTPTQDPSAPSAPPAPSAKGSKLIPPCALVDPSTEQYCNDVSDLVLLEFRVGEFLFTIIGGLAFAMFIYGGFKMILSFGSPEKFKEGKNVMVAAVVGLAIAFGAYLMIDFILDALSVTGDFRVVK